MSLYSLNKDMLVSIITTIEKQTKLKYIEKIKKTKKELKYYKDLYDLWNLSEDPPIIHKCNEQNCNALHNFLDDTFKNCIHMTDCTDCGENFCDKHGNMDTYCCNKCLIKKRL